MSNDVLNEGFFNNDEISTAEKIALCALLMGGTYSEQVTPDGKERIFGSLVYRKGMTKVPVVASFSHLKNTPDILNETVGKALGLTKGESVKEVFKKSASEILTDMSNTVKNNGNLSDAGLKGRAEQIRANVVSYFKSLREYNSAVTEKIVNDFLAKFDAEFANGKKNGMNNSPAKTEA